MLVTVDRNWAGFLHAFGAGIALAPFTPAPGSPVVIVGPGGAVTIATLPAGVSLREIDEPTDVPVQGFQAALAVASRHFGAPVRAFTMYPDGLLSAMEGKMLTELRAEHCDPSTVDSVRVEYVPVRNGDFDVTIGQVIRRGR